MTATICTSNKFDHAREQYYAEAGGYTLLRLTIGSRGGVIKTATASDCGAAPVYHEREKLIEAMCFGVQSTCGQSQDVSIDVDSKGRSFGEFTLQKSRDELFMALCSLAEKMVIKLRRQSERAHDAGLSDLYSDLCVVDGAPVYLSDGVYLDASGHLFE